MILTPEEAFFLTHQGDFHTKRKVSVSQVANTKKETVFKWLKDDALYETETLPDLERGTCELLIPKVRHAMPRHATPRHATHTTQGPTRWARTGRVRPASSPRWHPEFPRSAKRTC